MSDSYDWAKEDKAMQKRLEEEDDLPDTEAWDPADRVDPRRLELMTPARCGVCGKHLYYLVPVGSDPRCAEHVPQED